MKTMLRIRGLHGEVVCGLGRRGMAVEWTFVAQGRPWVKMGPNRGVVA